MRACLGLKRLLADVLEKRLTQTPKDVRVQLAERLSRLYVELLSGAASADERQAWEEKARKRLPELGMTIVDPGKEEIEKARSLARAGWDIWLSRTGADGKRGFELARKALGR